MPSQTFTAKLIKPVQIIIKKQTNSSCVMVMFKIVRIRDFVHKLPWSFILVLHPPPTAAYQLNLEDVTVYQSSVCQKLFGSLKKAAGLYFSTL